jgi:hypothetical protein
MAVAADYAQEMAAGVAFPPVVVFFDGSDYWLADGYHRTAAADLADLEDIEADVRQGSRRDAVLYSVGANASHGLRRTNADKRRAALTLLNDPEWAKWSDSEIARRCGVSHPFIGNVRREVSPETVTGEGSRTYTTRHGTTATMNVGGINADRITEAAPARQPATLHFDNHGEPDLPAAEDAPPIASAPAAPIGPAWTDSEIERREQVEAGAAVLANKRADAALLAWAEAQGKLERIDRASVFGNPFVMPDDGDRDAVCDLFANHYWPFKRGLQAKVGNLRGKVLVCWCYPERCHGETILKAVAETCPDGA